MHGVATSAADSLGVARLLLAMVLASAAVLKLRDQGRLRAFVAGLGIAGLMARLAAWAIIGVKLLVSSLLVVAPSRMAGVAACTLFLAFAIVSGAGG